MIKLASRIFRFIKQLMDFHRPHVQHLDYIDIVIEGKLVLLLAWDVTHTNKISIQPGKFKYRTSVTAVMCNLPGGTHAASITFHNFWRSRTVLLPLKPIPLDPQTFACLNARFPEKTSVVNLTPAAHFKALVAKTPKPRIRMKINLRKMSFSINQIQLTDYAP